MFTGAAIRLKFWAGWAKEFYTHHQLLRFWPNLAHKFNALAAPLKLLPTISNFACRFFSIKLSIFFAAHSCTKEKGFPEPGYCASSRPPHFVHPPRLCVHLGCCASTPFPLPLDQPKAGSNLISPDQKGYRQTHRQTDSLTDIELYINR